MQKKKKKKKKKKRKKHLNLTILQEATILIFRYIFIHMMEKYI